MVADLQDVHHQPGAPVDNGQAPAFIEFIQDTCRHSDARLRQSAAILDGCVVGAIKTAPDQLLNHPDKVFAQGLAAAQTGALFSLASEIKSPIVAGAMAAGGLVMTLGYVYNTGQKLGRDRELSTALDNIWRHSDRTTYASNIGVIEKSLGNESFDFAVSSLAAGAGYGSVKMANEMLKPTNPQAKLCIAGAPNAMTETLPQVAKPDTNYAMVWHRDRMGYEWNKLDPQALARYIEKTPLPERLDAIESFIKTGDLYKAYDHAEANMSWHQGRASFGDVHDDLSNQFFKIAMGIRNSWEEPKAGWLDKAMGAITETRIQFKNDLDWPFKFAPDRLTDVDRLYQLPLSARVDEIKALVDRDMFKDAATLANCNYALHQGTRNNYWGSKISGTENKFYNPVVSDRFDTLFLHLVRMYKPSWAKNLVPETSVVTINAQLSSLRKL